MFTSWILAAALVAPPQPVVMAHYMPWFAAKPTSANWGWHWTMGVKNPDRGELASHYRPSIGAYDSQDRDVLECQLLQMKLAGIDGVFIDWYGREDHFDYAINQRNTLALIQEVQKAGMKFAMVYEDQTVTQLIKAGKFTQGEAVAEGKELMHWAQKNWFSAPGYLKWDGRPVFLVFGPQYYADADWTAIFDGQRPAPAFFTLQDVRGPAAVGGFSWPYPGKKPADSWADMDAFYARAKAWKTFIPVAYPRFHDFYAEAGVHDSYGPIADDGGKTYVRTLTRALSSGAPIVQIATWNDWGEGTVIEPSVEYGYRDLEATQRLVKSKFKPDDLRLPATLLKLRRAHPKERAQQDQIAEMLRRGQTAQARSAIASHSRTWARA